MGDTSSSIPAGDASGAVQQQVQALSALQQPPAALPDICRAVFGAATPATLSTLYEIGRAGSDGGQQLARAAITAATAAWTLLLDSSEPPSQLVLQQFVQDVFLPLTAALGPDSVEGAQQLQQLSELLARHEAWALALVVLQCTHSSLQSVLAAGQPAQHIGQDGQLQLQVQLSPPTACAVVKQLTAAASSAAAVADSQHDADAAAGQLHAVLQLAAGPLFGTTLQLLCCPDGVRQAAFQQVLPELLQAAAALGPVQHRASLDQLLQQCLDMVSRPVVPRRMGLAVLLQYWADWQLQPPSAAAPTAAAEPQQLAGEDAACSSRSQAAANGRFWQLLRECLVDPEPLNRKRALRLLQLLLPKAQLQSEPEWGVFMALYELLDEFTAHLVKATWPLISHLHRPAAAYASEDPAADIPTAGKINPLSRGLQALQPPSQRQQQQSESMAFCWSSILWTQALQHSNLQVQRMAMKTLLKREWSQQMLQQVPASFITQVLLPALLSPLHHNTQPMSNLARSGAVVDPHKQQHNNSCSDSDSDAFDVTQQAAQLLRSYVLCAGPAGAREVFNGGLQVANLLKQDASRAGLQSVLQVLAAAAEGLQTTGPGLLDGLTAADAEAFAEASLRKLQLVLTRTMPWHGTSYKVACCSLVARIAATVAPPGSCSLATCARLLQEVPLWMLCPGQGVNAAVRAWLVGSDSSWVAQAAAGMWQQYLAGGGSSTAAGGEQQQQVRCATAPEYAVWHAASDAWLRVALCGDDLQQLLLTSAVAELADYSEQIMSRPYLPVGLPDRVLIMATQLLEFAEAACRPAYQHSQPAHSTAVLSTFTQAALRFSAGAGGAALVQLLQLHCSCYHDSSPAELAGSRPGTSAARPAAAGQLTAGLCPEAWQATARAESTAQAAAAAAVLMAQYLAAGGPQGSVSGLSAQQVLTSLTQLMRQMVAVSQALAGRPLPAVAVVKAAGDSGPAWGTAAAAAECSRASAVLVLRHLSQGLSRALSCLPQQHWPRDTLRLQPAVLINAMFREKAAAAAATTHWQPALAAAGATGDISAAWLNGLDWPCLDAALALAGLAGSHSAAAGAAAAAIGVSAHATAASGGGAERVPPGALQQDVLVLLLVEALNALQWSSLDALVHLLRGVRRVWALAVQDSSLQAAALAALEDAGLAQVPDDLDSSAASSGPLVALGASLAHSLLQVLHGNKKRPFLLCGCLVNTLLLPELMLFDPQQQPHLVALHAGPGAPLRRFVVGVLQQGASGSPTAHLVVALRLGACVPAAPHLLGWYAEQLQALLLFGTSIEGGLDSKLSLSSHEAATEWALLAEPLEPHLAAAGVMAGMGPRIAVVTALCQLAAAAGLVPSSSLQVGSKLELTPGSQQGSGGGDSFVEAAVAAGVELWREWMQVALHDPVLSVETHRNGCAAHRGRVRMWQGLSALVAFLGVPSQQEAATQAVKDLLAALECFNPPSVKQYQEASLTYLLLKHQHLIPQLLLPHLMDLEKGGAATASHILSAVQACLHSSQQEVLLPQLVNLLLPWTNHHTHNIRTFAQLGLCAVLEARPLDTWPAWQQGLGEGGVALLAALQRFFNGNIDFQRFRRNIGAGMLHWQPDAVVKPAGIFCSSLSLAGYEEGQASRVTFEGCPQSLMDTVVHFLHVERTKLREAAVDRAATAADAAAAAAAAAAPGGGSSSRNGQGAAAAGGSSRDAGEQAAGAAAGNGLQLDYQRKVTPSERAVLLADVLDDAFEAAAAAAAAAGSSDPSAPAGTRRHELVVVASLVDKVPNLAGLARTAEVLGAGRLVMSDLRVAQEPQFTGISVSAERWVPLEEVQEAALLGWLRGKKAAGYSLVGLEQTSESTQLQAFSFPPKSVLVLGREKEGIPPEIIRLLDATVEIPQLGVIRSLNVHVSGAIAMYEYTKQRLQGAGDG